MLKLNILALILAEKLGNVILHREKPCEKWHFSKCRLERKLVFIEHLLSYLEVYIQAYILIYIFYLHNPYKNPVWQLLLILFYR